MDCMTVKTKLNVFTESTIGAVHVMVTDRLPVPLLCAAALLESQVTGLTAELDAKEPTMALLLSGSRASTMKPIKLEVEELIFCRVSVTVSPELIEVLSGTSW